MNMREWAEREIRIACERERANSHEEFDYGCACYESAFRAFNSLLGDEHSGMSISITKSILNRLIDGKPLTPIEDTPDVWENSYFCKDIESFQCNRMTSLFKDVYPDGTIAYHDTNRCYCVNKDNPKASGWYNGFISKLIHEKYPITMPYCPTSKPYTAYCTEGLFDPKNGDFDSIGIWYVVTPDGEKDVIERFFAESDEGWTEISKEEYLARVENDCSKSAE